LILGVGLGEGVAVSVEVVSAGVVDSGVCSGDGSGLGSADGVVDGDGLGCAAGVVDADGEGSGVVVVVVVVAVLVPPDRPYLAASAELTRTMASRFW
jgi:hypothetical protein